MKHLDSEFHLVRDRGFRLEDCGGSWNKVVWSAAPAELDAAKHRTTAMLLTGVAAFYIDVIHQRNLIIRSVLRGTIDGRLIDRRNCDSIPLSSHGNRFDVSMRRRLSGSAKYRQIEGRV